MRKIEKVFLSIMMALLLGVFLAMVPGKVNAGMCVGATQSFGCGDTVTESCALDGDMECPEGDGLIVGADNITIDGNGFCLDGVNPGSCEDLLPRSGIYNNTFDDVVIKNLEITNLCNGIWLFGKADEDEIYRNTIEGCHIHNNGNENQVVQAIGLDYVYDSTIKKNNIHHNIGCFGAPPGGCGIYLCGGDRNKFIENIITDNDGTGMFIRGRPEYNEVYYNYVTGNLFGGIRLMCVATAYSTVEYNYSTNNECAGIMVAGPDNTLKYNTSTDNKNTTQGAPGIGGVPPFGWGIVLARSADGNSVSFNTACGNEQADIEERTLFSNSGESNACDNAVNWNDNGTTGCMYACDARPVAGFSGKPVSGPVPLKVQFADESIGIIDTWSWDFDDGEPSNERNPIHIYNDTGKYTVRLTVSGDGGSDTETKPAYINVTAIYADFSADKTKGLVPFEVEFTDNSTSQGADIVEWHWDFGDEGISEVQDPTHEYENVGSYDVSLTVVNNNGESNTKTKKDYIQIKSVIADFSAAGEPHIPESPREGFTPFTVQFTDESQLAEGKEIDSWLWDFGDGVTDPDPNPTHVYILPEDENCRGYTVSLRVTCGEEEDTTIKYDYIVVARAALADFSAEPTSGDAPLTVQFTNKSEGFVVNYEWDFGDKETSHEENPVHIYENPSTYTVSLTAIHPYWGSNTKTREDYIVVTGTGTPLEAGFFADPTSGTAPLVVQFSDETTGGSPPYSYEWDFDNSGSVNSTEQNPTHTYRNTGTYTVSLKVTDSEGHEDTQTKTDYITVTEPGAAPEADFSASPKSGGAPLTVNFTDSSTGDIDGYAWSFGDGGTSTEKDPTYTYQNIGTYTVSLTVSGTGGSDNETKTDYITVTGSGEAPDADFSASPKSGGAPLAVQFADFSTGEINSWSWSFGDNETSEEQNPPHVYERPGAFPVSLTVSGPGGSNTRTKNGYITVRSQTPWHFNDEPHDEWPWWWF